MAFSRLSKGCGTQGQQPCHALAKHNMACMYQYRYREPACRASSHVALYVTQRCSQTLQASPTPAPSPALQALQPTPTPQAKLGLNDTAP